MTRGHDKAGGHGPRHQRAVDGKVHGDWSVSDDFQFNRIPGPGVDREGSGLDLIKSVGTQVVITQNDIVGSPGVDDHLIIRSIRHRGSVSTGEPPKQDSLLACGGYFHVGLDIAVANLVGASVENLWINTRGRHALDRPGTRERRTVVRDDRPSSSRLGPTGGKGARCFTLKGIRASGIRAWVGIGENVSEGVSRRGAGNIDGFGYGNLCGRERRRKQKAKGQYPWTENKNGRI